MLCRSIHNPEKYPEVVTVKRESFSKMGIIFIAVLTTGAFVSPAMVTAVQGYWGSKGVGAPDYEAITRNVTLMSDEEDDAFLPKGMDAAAFAPVFARQAMNKFGIFQEELKGAVPGEPVFVRSLDENRHDHYLIPFEKDGAVSVVAIVFLKGDVVDFGGAFPPCTKTQNIAPTLEEAKEALSENGYDSDWDARLVWTSCDQTLVPGLPLWEFTMDDGSTVYAGYVPSKDRVEIYEKLTVSPIGG